MEQFEFQVDDLNYFQVKLLEDFRPSSDCEVFFKNDTEGLDVFITQCSLSEILMIFQSIYEETLSDQRNILPFLYKKGVTYYYLLDSYLIQNEIKWPCDWTKYLESLSIFTHYHFCWVYRLGNETFLELGFGTNLLENERLPQPLEGVMLLRKKMEPNTLQSFVDKVLSVRALM